VRSEAGDIPAGMEPPLPDVVIDMSYTHEGEVEVNRALDAGDAEGKGEESRLRVEGKLW